MTQGTLKFDLASPLQQEFQTTRQLNIWIDDEVVWPVAGEKEVRLEIQIDDLLSYLTEYWKPLLLRQTYPIPVMPDFPSLLRAAACSRWANLPAEVGEKEDDQVTAFEEAHDLSRCFAGLFGLPPFWLLRRGQQMLCETADRRWLLSYDAACEALTEIGNAIAAWLGDTGDSRWSNLLRDWRERDTGEPLVLLAWSTSLEKDVARQFEDEGMLSAPKSLAEAANDNDELRIAARIVSALPTEQIREVIKLAREFDKNNAPKLESLSTKVSEFLAKFLAENLPNRQPFAQGEAVANFVRDQLGFTSVQVLDIFKLMTDLGVKVAGRRVEPPTLDGLAVWGPMHGPGALINEASRRIANRGFFSRNAGVRVTLAHEFCHLLVDRGHALSAVDILNSRMPNDIERRAKAFAGEFLLPSRVAADMWRDSGSPTTPPELDSFVERLRKRYSVTRSVAAWKLEHGLLRQNVDLSTVSAVLDHIAPWR
jgi:Zn-dependent peptidase ImmA (M78 family)